MFSLQYDCSILIPIDISLQYEMYILVSSPVILVSPALITDLCVFCAVRYTKDKAGGQSRRQAVRSQLLTLLDWQLILRARL